MSHRPISWPRIQPHLHHRPRCCASAPRASLAPDGPKRTSAATRTETWRRDAVAPKPNRNAARRPPKRQRGDGVNGDWTLQLSLASSEAKMARAILKLPLEEPVATVLTGPVIRQFDADPRQVTALLSHLSMSDPREVGARRAQDVLSELERAGAACASSPHVCTRVMSILNRSNMGRASLALFARKLMAGAKLDRVAFNTAISAAAGMEDAGRAEEVYRRMLAAGIRPDTFTYSALISACELDWQRAVRLFREMPERGVEPNVVVFTSLMTVLQRAGQPAQALAIFQEMEASGVQPDVIAYNALIAAWARTGEWERAWGALAAMKREGMQPDTVTYNSLLAACERGGQVERAFEIYDRMCREGGRTYGLVQPNLITFNTLIAACAKSPEWSERALELLEQMREEGHAPDEVTLASVLTVLADSGRWEMAEEMFRTLTAEGVRPNTWCYNSYINALSTGGHWQRALLVLDDMQRNEGAHAAPDTITFSSVIQACARGGAKTQALALLERMKQQGIEPNAVTYMNVVSACEDDQDWRTAVKLFEEMRSRGVAMEGVGMVARRIVYGWPGLMDQLPGWLVLAVRGAVNSGRAARRWVESGR